MTSDEEGKDRNMTEGNEWTMIHPGGFLRSSIEEPAIWCPGCKEHHVLPWKRGGWTFNGNTERPTFTPSFRISGGAGSVCHFVLTDGILNFCSDSSHELAGKSVPLPKLDEENDIGG